MPADSAVAGAALPVLLAVVSEKTGYPAESIGPDMDLESDLGIDSIKRVEILSAIAEKLPEAPRVKPEHLGTLRTLRSLAQYLSAGGSAAAGLTACGGGTSSPDGSGTLPGVAEPNGIAELPTVAGARLRRLVPGLAPLAPRDARPLERGLCVAVTRDSGLDQALLRELRARGLRAEPVALDDPASLPADLGALVLVAPLRPAARRCPWTAESEAWLKKAFWMVQAAGRRFQETGGRGRLFAVTRLDGALGLAGCAGQDPLFGGLAGLMKTAAVEWPSLGARAIDVDPALSADAAAQRLVREFGFEGPVEVGLGESGMRTVSLVERRAAIVGEPLRPGDAVIVTGGGRGVTAECALALARAFRPRLVLIGRSPLPGLEPAHLAGATGEAELRSAIAEAARGLSPKAIAEKARAVLASREIRRTLFRLSEAGVEFRYRTVDARDAGAVRALVAETAADWGPVRGLVHGAGVLADKALLDKTPEQLDAVLDTKLAGLRHCLDALEPSELRLIALFSSSTARYGRAGQSDYAIANEALNKAAQSLAERNPECRVFSIGWGPWDGGMVDAALKRLFAAEGVGVIGLADGAAHFVAESRAAGPVETVVLAAPAGGSRPALATSFERDLTLEDFPFLESHVLGGRAVLPLAVSVEWLAHAAAHAHPGLCFLGFDELRVHKGVLVRRGASTAVAARAGALEKRDGHWAVTAELRGADATLHVSVTVLLGSSRPAAPAPALEIAAPAYPRGLDDAYRDVLFHGPDMRFLLAVPACGPGGVVAEARTAAPPASWACRPPRESWLSDPAALDAAFQAMILWTAQEMGAPSLPSYAARYRQYVERFPQGGVRVAAKAARRSDGLAAADIEFIDERGALVARLEGYECAADASLAAAFRRNALEAA